MADEPSADMIERATGLARGRYPAHLFALFGGLVFCPDEGCEKWFGLSEQVPGVSVAQVQRMR